MLGGIFFGLRHWIGAQGFYVREGLARHHETSMSIVKEHPIAATLGSAEGIDHRTGIELGVVFFKSSRGLICLWEQRGDFSMNYFPDQFQPHLYAYLQVEFILHLGQKGSQIVISKQE